MIRCFLGIHNRDEFGECERCGDVPGFDAERFDRVERRRYAAKRRRGEARQSEMAMLGFEGVTLELMMDDAVAPGVLEYARSRRLDTEAHDAE